jgi:LysM repeat protein
MLTVHRLRYLYFLQTSLLILSIFASFFITPLTQPSAQAQSGSTSRADLILAINTLRVSNGLPALSENAIVNAVAQSTAEIMAANNMSWHIGDVRGRIAAAGYGAGATVWATENFAVGNMSIDQIMQVWADAEHMRMVVNPAYCDIGAGVAKASNGKTYYIVQAAYTSEYACGEYIPVPGSGSENETNPQVPMSNIIVPVKIATPDEDGKIFHTVQSGQSFWSIAIAYQLTIHDLEVWNNLSRDYGLYIGQKLFIPSKDTEGYATPTPAGMVLTATPDTSGRVIHEVQPYQALIMIAEAYNIQVDRLLVLNGLLLDTPLQIGQQLLIDLGNITPTPTPRPLTAIEQLTPASDGKYYHTVQSGEYLAVIAEKYQVTVNQLMAWNNLSSASILRPGQSILLQVTPPASPTPLPISPSYTLVNPRESPMQTVMQPLESTLEFSEDASTSGSDSFLSKLGSTLIIVLTIIALIILTWFLWHR